MNSMEENTKRRIRTNEPAIRNLLDTIGSLIDKKCIKRRYNYTNNITMLSNRIFLCLSETPSMSFANITDRYNELFDEPISKQKIEDTLDYFHLRNWRERKEVFVWIDQAIELLAAALNGSRRSLSKLQKQLTPFGSRSQKHPERCRIFYFRLYRQYPELYCFNKLDAFLNLNGREASELLDGILQSIDQKNNVEKLLREQQKQAACEIAGYKSKLQSLEESALRTNLQLTDLQDGFDSELETVKNIELTDFFSQLNSEKYGRILDQLLTANDGFATLAQNNYQLPIELNGVRIMVKKLIQFTRDCHIIPILQPGNLLKVKATDIEFYEYLGAPFPDENEEKLVRVISAGWLYQDKEIQISKPILQEVTNNAALE